MKTSIQFTVYGRPQPQGSFRPINHAKTGRAILKQSNKNMLPYRHAVSQVAAIEFRGVMAAKHVPVEMTIDFVLAKPASAKKREWPSVKPDIDKLERCILDALTGIAYLDDGQVVRVIKQKLYGLPERTEITVTAL